MIWYTQGPWFKPGYLRRTKCAISLCSLGTKWQLNEAELVLFCCKDTWFNLEMFVSTIQFAHAEVPSARSS
jgi:hypothetical protein